MIKLINIPSLNLAINSVVEFCKDNKQEKIEIIVPDKLSLFMEKFLFEQMNIKASFNLRVSTLNRFAKRKIKIDKESQISKIGSILLIYKILNENKSNLKVLNSKSYTFTYAENIFKTISQLKASKIQPTEMFEKTTGFEDLDKKILDIALIYQQYENQKAGMLDASDLFLASTLSVGEGVENKKIVFVGFDDYTAIEYSIIEQFAKITEVFVFNCYNRTSNKHIFNNEIYDQLKQIAYTNELDFKTEDLNLETDNLHKFLNGNLFAVKDNEYVLEDNTVQIYSCRKVKEEIDVVARDIRSKILNGESYKNFGVAVFNVESYENEIAEIFSKYEINYYFDTELSINQSVFYKFICSILKYNLNGYQLTNLLDIINSPFFEVEQAEKEVLTNKLISINYNGKLKSDFALSEELFELTEKFKMFIEDLTFDKKENVKTFIEGIKNFIIKYEVEKIIDNLAEFNTILQKKIILTKSVSFVMELFDEILKFNKDITIDEFYDIFSHISSVAKINNLPLTLDAVKVVDANNTMEIFEDLYVVNCTYENAPNLKFDCGIILDTEIEKLKFVHKLNPTIAHINKLSRLRLFNLLTLFKRDLILTYSQNPSDAIKELLKKIKINIDGEILNLIPFSNFNSGRYTALSERDFIEYNLKNNLKSAGIDEKILKNKDFSSISNKNLNIYNNFKTISASTLENYFKCPFYMFLQNVLKITPRLNNEILSFDVGNILHEVMCKYYKRKKQVADIYEFCKNEIFKFIERDERLKLNATNPIILNLIDEAVRAINNVNYIDSNSSFQNILVEHEFRNENELQLKNISIIGKIDRVDRCNNFLRIIDYKTGDAEASLKDLYYGKKLQLFLYANAIENELKQNVVGCFYLPLHNKYTREEKNTTALDGFFLNEDFIISALDKNAEPNYVSDIVNMKLNKDGKVLNQPTNSELQKLKNYAIVTSENAVDEIKSGYIKPSPLKYSDVCKYCPYSQICLREADNYGERVAQSVKLDSFKEVDDE